MNNLTAKRDIVIASLIFSLALILRLTYLFSLRNNYFFYDHPATDVLFYQQWAHEIARGNWLGEKIFSGMPLYPYFLAVIDRLTLGQTFLMRLVHIILGAFNCILVYYLAKRLFTIRIACLASFLCATNFILIYYDWLMMPVPLLITISLIVILSLLHLDDTSKRNEWFILGLFIGLGTLGDGKFLIFLIFILITLIGRYRRNFTQVLSKIFLPLLAGIFIVLSLVTVRNKIVGGGWIFISGQSGLNFYVGNNPEATGFAGNPSFARPSHSGNDEDQKIMAELLMNRSLTPGEVTHFWMGESLKFIRNSPIKYLVLLKKKFVIFFTDTEIAFDIDLLLQRDWKNRFDINPFFLICPLAFLGMVMTRHRQKDIRFINTIIFSQLIFTLIFYLNYRHRVTILPFMLVYEAYTIEWIITQIKHKNFRNILLLGGGILSYLVIFRPVAENQRMVDFYRYAKAGPIFERRKEYTKAQQQYLKALRIIPNDVNALYNMANSYFLQGKFKEAVKYYKEALSIFPHNVDVLFNLAYTNVQLGNKDDALKLYGEVLKLQPESVDAHYQIAEIYKDQGMCLEAKGYYRNIIKIKPQLAREINILINECK